MKFKCTSLTIQKSEGDTSNTRGARVYFSEVPQADVPAPQGYGSMSLTMTVAAAEAFEVGAEYDFELGV